jgi:hypothetical protein
MCPLGAASYTSLVNQTAGKFYRRKQSALPKGGVQHIVPLAFWPTNRYHATTSVA